MKLLKDLGVHPGGRMPGGRTLALRNQRLGRLPSGLGSLLTSRCFNLRSKQAIARLMMSLPKIDSRDLVGVTVQEWVVRQTDDSGARLLLLALNRLTSYSNEPALQCASAAVEQLQLALAGNVLYADHGWQSLCDSLLQISMQFETTVHCFSPVAELRRDGDQCVSGVVLNDGTEIVARNVVLAVPPSAATRLIPDEMAESVHAFAAAAIPVRAASLTVGLKRSQNGQAPFVLGLDEPLYYSVHSEFAKLTPDSGSLIHVMKYLDDHQQTSNELRSELESLLCRMLPDWKTDCVVEQFLPGITVVPALDLAASDGASGRPAVSVEQLPGLWLAGDWVGNEGMLADASIASGYRAAEAVLNQRSVSCV